MLKKISIFVFILFVISCTSEEKPTKNEQTSASQAQTYPNLLGPEVRLNFPSPVEIPLLLKSEDIPFSEQYIVNAEDPKEYTTDFYKALAIGFYSADLGYTLVYDKPNMNLRYIVLLKNLAEDFGAGHFFELANIRSIPEKQFLIQVTFLSFYGINSVDSHLRDKGKYDISTLIQCGFWLENFYHAVQAAKEHSNDNIKWRIAEQKIVLKEVKNMLSGFEDNEIFKVLLDEIKEIDEIYDEIVINTKNNELKKTDNDYTIRQDEITTIDYTEQQIELISEKISTLRNRLITMSL